MFEKISNLKQRAMLIYTTVISSLLITNSAFASNDITGHKTEGNQGQTQIAQVLSIGDDRHTKVEVDGSFSGVHINVVSNKAGRVQRPTNHDFLHQPNRDSDTVNTDRQFGPAIDSAVSDWRKSLKSNNNGIFAPNSK